MSSRTVAMSEPVCLIENSENGMHVLPQAMEILKQIDQPVVVVAIVGLYRTGKSYLMNRLAGKQKGFALGSTTQAQTKGIWMWCVPHPKKENHTLVLLDTEGLGDTEKGDEKNDTWLFCLAVLLSSTLVYNSRGTIDNRALADLQYMTELTKHIKVRSQSKDEDESTEFVHFFPSFVWAVRDFTLELVHDGKQITADQYLENALKLKSGCGEQVVKYNRPRECLQRYFPSRKCFVFDLPASKEKMRRMDDLSDKDLEPSFVEQASHFCDHVISETKTKTVKGSYDMTGKRLGTLVKLYVEAISSGQIPCLENAVVALAQIENSNAIAEAVKDYKETMAKVTFPTETQKELEDIHGRAKKNAVQIFKSRCFKDEDQKNQLELMSQLQTEYEEFCKRNVDESKKACESIIGCIFEPLEKNVASGRYSTVGGYQKYCAELKNCTAKYRSAPGKGIKSKESLKEYLAQKESNGKAIMATDQSLSDAQRREEEKQAEIEAMKREKHASEEQIKKLEEERRAAEESKIVRELEYKKQQQALREARQREEANRAEIEAMKREKAVAMERDKAAAMERERAAAMERERAAAMERERAAAMEREKAAAMEREIAAAMEREKHASEEQRKKLEEERRAAEESKIARELEYKTGMDSLKQAMEILKQIYLPVMVVLAIVGLCCTGKSYLMNRPAEKQKGIAEAVKDYKDTMAREVKFPTETQKELEDIHGRAKRKAVQIFKSLCFQDEDQKNQLELMKQLQTEYKAICERNGDESKKSCESIIRRIFEPLENTGRYSIAGGYQKYCTELENCITKYRSAPGKGIKSKESLKEYLAQKESTRKYIEEVDKYLTEQQAEIEAKERAAAEEKAAKERAAAEEKAAKERAAAEEKAAKVIGAIVGATAATALGVAGAPMAIGAAAALATAAAVQTTFVAMRAAGVGLAASKIIGLFKKK